MTEEKRAYIDGLRQLADWLEDHPMLPAPSSTDFYIFAYSKEKFSEYARGMGKAEKSSSGGYFNITHEFPGELKLQLTATHGAVCEKVKVGTRKVVKKVYPDVQPTEEIVEEDIYEWVCPESVLRGDNAAS
jgi:hypothetical protein